MPVKIYKIFLIAFLNVLPIAAQQGLVNVTVDAKVQTLMSLKKEVNQNQSVIKIQIYNGSREKAEEYFKK